jgi:sugar diacid utilization regulator
MQLNDLAQDVHQLLRCKDLQELLDTGRQHLSSPIILADITFHVLAITEDSTISDPRWIQINAQRSVPMNVVNLELYQSALRSGSPVLSTDSTGLPIVRCAVAQEGRLIGYLLSPGYGGVPTQEQLDLLGLVSDLCALRMQKELHYAEYPEDMLEFFIADLLNGVLTEEQKIVDRCRFFHWDVRLPYRVLTIRSKGDAAMGGDYLRLEQHRCALEERFPDTTAFLYGSQIKLILHVYDETTQDALVLGEVASFLNQRNLVAGVSQNAYHLRNLSARHQQAMKALEMGLLLDGTGPLFYYDTYSIYHCLEVCSQNMDLVQLCHSAVRKLESYDRKNGTELLGTLHAYLSCRRNLSEAAASLYIHRNPMSKRLEKINDLIHVDLEDAETVFHLMFSYRILEYYGVTVMRDSYESWMEKSPTLRHK